MHGIADGDFEITGVRGAISKLRETAENILGFDVSRYKIYDEKGAIIPESREALIADIRKAFQLLVPITLAEQQSANSISNRDVKILATAIVSDMLEQDDILGSLLTASEEVIFNKMSYAHGLFEESFQENQKIMDTLDTEFAAKLDYYIDPTGKVTARRAGELVSAYRPEPEPEKGAATIIKWRDVADTPAWKDFSKKTGRTETEVEDQAYIEALIKKGRPDTLGFLP